MRHQTAGLTILVLLLATLSVAQTAPAPGGTGVPPVLRFSGTLAVPPGRVPVTFGLYADQTGGEPLWQETQTVPVDATGRYAVVLGSATVLPMEVFVSGEARWLDVAVGGLAPQPRALLVSVPYALKAADAETIGGKPLSAFVLAGEKTGTAADGLTYLNPRALTTATKPLASGAGVLPQGAGSAGYLGVFTDSVNLGNSVIFQSGSSIGVGTTTPAASFHVAGTSAPAAFFDVYSNALIALPVVYRAARGTPAAPAAVQTDDILGGLAVRGYAPAGFTGGQGQVMFKAAENWSNTGHGVYLQFTTTPVGAVDWVERMRITPAGYVGIGTSTPTFPLQVAIGGSSQAMFGTSKPLWLGSYAPAVGFNVYYDGSWKYGTAGAGAVIWADDTSGLQFVTAPTSTAGAYFPYGSANRRMSITPAGLVGIGTVSPTEALDVVGNINSSATLSGAGLSLTGGATIAGSVSAGASTFTDTTTNGTGLTGIANNGSNGWGVYGLSGAGVGVMGRSVSMTGYAGRFENLGGGSAIGARVNSTDVMTVDLAGVHAGPGMTGTPYAYGYIDYDCTLMKVSSNVTACSKSGTGVYLITLASTDYCYNQFVTIVTANSSTPLIPYPTSSGCGGGSGKLYIALRNLSAVNVDAAFYFVVFKP